MPFSAPKEAGAPCLAKLCEILTTNEEGVIALMQRARLAIYLLLLLVAAAALAQVPAEDKYVVTATLDRADGMYKCGEEATFAVTVKKNDAILTTGQFDYTLSNDGFKELSRGQGQLGEQPTIIKGTLAVPGVLRLTVTKVGDKTMWTIPIGAGYELDKIRPAADEPADFVSYWEEQKALLRAIPPDMQMTKLDANSNDKQTTYQFSMANINGSRVYGWLSVPVKEGKLPAMVLVPAASVKPYGPGWVGGWGGNGFLTMGIYAHNYPVDLPAAKYDELQKGDLNGYPTQGRDSRDTAYFRRVFLSCTRAMDYLMSRPEWDGKNLLVTGSSQGGGLSLVSAGLEPKVTAIAANVPALCDHSGILIDRISGWPRMIAGKDAPSAKVAPYFDAVNFARHAKCATVISCGFADATCPATSVYAAYSVLPQPKLMVPTPNMGHAQSKEYADLSSKFLNALGKMPPTP